MSIKTTIAAAVVGTASMVTAAVAQDGPSIVLVHGAWANGSSWEEVVPLLQKHGLHVVAVHNPESSFEADVAATRRVIDDQPGKVILVGHSYGGAVITEAGNNDKVTALVYVAAVGKRHRWRSAAAAGLARRNPCRRARLVDLVGYRHGQVFCAGRLSGAVGAAGRHPGAAVLGGRAGTWSPTTTRSFHRNCSRFSPRP
jgi:pimeloyl-ACP methyl ester carboxylesterase